MGALLVCVSFLLGSFPSGLVLARLATGRDVRTVGSGNVGAANVVRAAGWRVGVLVALLDIAKGVLPVLAGRQIGLDAGWLALVAVAAVVGHDFSIALAFRGGKGVATTIGACLALAPLGTLPAVLAYPAVLFASGYSSLASLTTLALIPLTLGLTDQPPAYVTAASFLFVLGALKHWENIVRLLNGTESGFHKRRSSDGS